MGTRLNVFAVDVSQLDSILDASIGELLARYVRDGSDPNRRLIFTVSGSDDTFTANPGGAIRAALTQSDGRVCTTLDEEQLRTIPTLQRSAREFLTNEPIYSSKWFLAAFSHCNGIDGIKQLIDGHRRWWIGSVLQSAQNALERSDHDQLVRLFRDILRGFNCGYDMPISDIGVITEGLPFEPENDPDLRFGRWSEGDVKLAMTLLSEIIASSPTFTRPSGPIGIAPDDSEWQSWVEGNVASLLRIRDLPFEKCNVLSFIG